MKMENSNAHHGIVNPDFEVWSSQITNLDSKKIIAKKLASKVNDGDLIGVGSGSTAYLTVHEIGQRVAREGIMVTAITSSIEMTFACAAAKIPVTTLFSAVPDWTFDGADEIDARGRLIKGRGGALLHEKALMVSSPITFIVADATKQVDHLGSKFAVPVEVVPYCVHHAITALKKLGASNVAVRSAKGVGKDGPAITEAGNLLLDAKFEDINDSLERDIASVVGVVESGLFIGYRVELIHA
jgi:ribose 5-phosphate isomerase A